MASSHSPRLNEFTETSEEADWASLIEFWQILSNSKSLADFQRTFKEYLNEIPKPKKVHQEKINVILRQLKEKAEFEKVLPFLDKFLKDLSDSESNGKNFMVFIEKTTEESPFSIVDMLEANIQREEFKVQLPEIKTGTHTFERALESETKRDVATDDPIRIGDDLFHLGVQQVTSGDHKSAVESYNKAVAFYDKYISLESLAVHVDLVECYFFLGQFSKIEEQINLARQKFIILSSMPPQSHDIHEDQLNTIKSCIEFHNFSNNAIKIENLIETKEYKEAEKWLLLSLKSSETIDIRYLPAGYKEKYAMLIPILMGNSFNLLRFDFKSHEKLLEENISLISNLLKNLPDMTELDPWKVRFESLKNNATHTTNPDTPVVEEKSASKDPIRIGDELFYLGCQQMKNEDEKSAEDSFNKALVLYNEHVSFNSITVHLNLVSCYFILGKFSEIEEQINLARQKYIIFSATQNANNDSLKLIKNCIEFQDFSIQLTKAGNLIIANEYKKAEKHLLLSIKFCESIDIHYLPAGHKEKYIESISDLMEISFNLLNVDFKSHEKLVEENISLISNLLKNLPDMAELHHWKIKFESLKNQTKTHSTSTSSTHRANLGIFVESKSQIEQSDRKEEIVEEDSWSISKCAERFDEWMKIYTMHAGTHNEELVDWLSADEGAKHVQDYKQFCELAALLKPKGYSTVPPPSESEFAKGISEYAKIVEEFKRFRY